MGNSTTAAAQAPVSARAAPPADTAAARLDAGRRARLKRAARDAALQYPNHPELQRAAVDAALEYLRGTSDLAQAGADWGRARDQEQRVRARVRQLAVMAVADEVSERSVARVLGVDRMTLRRWSGKTAAHARVETPEPSQGDRR
jgi:hypothetical protein